MESFKIRVMTAVWAYTATVATVSAGDTAASLVDAAIENNTIETNT